MPGIITNIEVSKSIAPFVDICGSALSPPYVVPQYYYVCVTAYIRNTGTQTEEYKLELLSPQGEVVDTEPDSYWVNVSPGENISITVSGALMYEGLYNFSVRLKRCVCTSWTGCLFSCDSEPVDAVRNIQVSTEPGTPPPPADKYYDCINGQCVEVYYPTQYLNNPSCNNACYISPPPPPPPPTKWKCSGAPNYVCTQAADGTYNTQAACVSACRSGVTPPPPPSTKYYKCVNNQCTQTPEQTQYINDPTCGGTCKPAAQEKKDYTLYALAGLVGVGAIAIIIKKRKAKQR